MLQAYTGLKRKITQAGIGDVVRSLLKVGT